MRLITNPTKLNEMINKQPPAAYIRQQQQQQQQNYTSQRQKPTAATRQCSKNEMK